MIFLKSNPFARVVKPHGKARSGHKALPHEVIIDTFKIHLCDKYNRLGEVRLSTTPDGMDAVCSIQCIEEYFGQANAWIGFRHCNSGRYGSRAYGGVGTPFWSIVMNAWKFRAGPTHPRAMDKTIEKCVMRFFAALDTYEGRLEQLHKIELSSDRIKSIAMSLAASQVIPLKKTFTLDNIQPGESRKTGLQFLQTFSKMLYDIPPITSNPESDHMGRMLFAYKKVTGKIP